MSRALPVNHKIKFSQLAALEANYGSLSMGNSNGDEADWRGCGAPARRQNRQLSPKGDIVTRTSLRSR